MHLSDVRLAAIEAQLPLLKSMHVTWVVVADGSEENIGRATFRLAQEGIMVIARPDRKINGGADFGWLASRCGTKYNIIYNEFGDEREWRGDRRPRNWWEVSVNNWIAQAHKVRARGCYPGLQILSARRTTEEESHTTLWDFLTEMKQRGEESLWEDMFLALHLYPRVGCPPEARCHEDDALAFLDYAEVCKEIMGFIPPIMVTEWAWAPSQAPPDVRAKYVTEVFNWFRTGRLSNGQSLPDYLFAFFYWIVGDGQWYGWSLDRNPDHWPVRDAIKAMPKFERGKPGPSIPPEEPRDWRVVSPWMMEAEALKDSARLGILGFNHYKLERR